MKKIAARVLLSISVNVSVQKEAEEDTAATQAEKIGSPFLVIRSIAGRITVSGDKLQ